MTDTYELEDLSLEFDRSSAGGADEGGSPGSRPSVCVLLESITYHGAVFTSRKTWDEFAEGHDMLTWDQLEAILEGRETRAHREYHSSRCYRW